MEVGTEKVAGLRLHIFSIGLCTSATLRWIRIWIRWDPKLVTYISGAGSEFESNMGSGSGF
jgi:hypothetical protein